MIECIFTIDYEIYGNGEGSLRELVYEPGEKLRHIFRKWNVPCVIFVEVAELEMIEAKGTDPAIELVKKQIRNFYNEGHEIGLHLHPQWYRASHQKGKWELNYCEYNLCSLPKERIVQLIDRAIVYMRGILGESDFTPFSFRAGNWLFMPAKNAAEVLAERGIKVDSSVFKGGRQHLHNLDYRRARKNGYHWKFRNEVTTPDSTGNLLEVPIYTEMAPVWRLLTPKRIGIQRKGSSAGHTLKEKCYRVLDMMRIGHPIKFDFCSLRLDEMTRMFGHLTRMDQKNPEIFKPIVLIGHTKDMMDISTFDSFLAFLDQKKVRTSTFGGIYQKCFSQGNGFSVKESSLRPQCS